MENNSGQANEKEDTFCEWCGENPTYIGVYEDDDCSKEVFICQECYEDTYE